MKAFTRAARRYADRLEPDTTSDHHNDLFTRTRAVLVDLHLTSRFQRESLRAQWGEEYDFYGSMYEGLSGKIKNRKQQLQMGLEGKWGWLTKLGIASDSIKFLASKDNSKNEKEHLLELAGYSKEEAIDITLKLAKSAAWSVGTTVLFNSLIGYFEIYFNTRPDNMPISDKKTLIEVGVSYLLHYGSLVWFTHENLRLLRNPRVGNSPNVLATAPYYLSRSLTNKEKYQNAWVLFGTLLPVVPQELFLIPGLFVGNLGPAAAIGRNAAGIVFTAGQALAVRAYHEYVKRNEKKAGKKSPRAE